MALASEFKFVPDSSMGVAAPMKVPGAMAEACAAKVIGAPALPAKAFLGETYTITGMVLARISVMISSIASMLPPGVLS